jgi:hypothetical protein
MQDGVSRGKLQIFMEESSTIGATYSNAQAKEVLVKEQEKKILAEGTTYEPLKAARKAEAVAKDDYTKSQQALGRVQKQQAAAVQAMNSAMTAYNESLTNPNGNVQTSVQHEYLNAIDDVANFNSAL